MAPLFLDGPSALQESLIAGLGRNNEIQKARDQWDAERGHLQWALDDAPRQVGGAHEKMHQMQLDADMSRSQAMQHANTIQSLNAKVAELEALVEQQKLTIINQDRTMEEIRTQVQRHVSPDKLFPVTPQNPGRGRMGYQCRSPGVPPPPSFHGASSAPPHFNGNVYNQNPPQFGAGTNSTMALALASQATPASQMQTFAHNNFGNAGVQPQTQVFRIIPDPFVSGEGQIQAPQIIPDGFGSVQPQTQALQSIPNPFGLTHPYNFENGALEFERRFAHLWIRTQKFGELQTNIPDMQRDKAMDQVIEEYIMKVSSKRIASKLLSDPSSRRFLVTKALNFYIVEEVLKLTTISGFDKNIDDKVANCIGQLYPDTEPSRRQSLLIEMSFQLNMAKTSSGFTEFCRAKAFQHAKQLWKLVSPLTSESTHAWIELSSIVSEAQGLAADMYSVPCEFKINFPPVHAAFKPSEMVNREPTALERPEYLVQKGFKVRLAISPLVSIQYHTERMTTSWLLSYANVLLYQQQK
ncbi:hypothetical protein PHISCL_02352 [Aspergillus sclerotialis]|uniref:Uncharacterized protein n=1 Tax=Aspergillus sclerotialis TaxID=2070753 RepID=A0A3A2ZSN0_9EURO|nr:hypothetical protein PHISCL_02352 [Aspergillus sclerotialis]